MLEVDRIKERAKAKDISLRKLYRALELPQEYLRDVNAGKTTLSEARLEKIADYLDTTVEYLRGETDEKNKPAPKNENELVVDTNELNLLVQFYKCLSEDAQKELMAKALEIWTEDRHNKP